MQDSSQLLLSTHAAIVAKGQHHCDMREAGVLRGKLLVPGAKIPQISDGQQPQWGHHPGSGSRHTYMCFPAPNFPSFPLNKSSLVWVHQRRAPGVGVGGADLDGHAVGDGRAELLEHAARVAHAARAVAARLVPGGRHACAHACAKHAQMPCILTSWIQRLKGMVPPSGWHARVISNFPPK